MDLPIVLVEERLLADAHRLSIFRELRKGISDSVLVDGPDPNKPFRLVVSTGEELAAESSAFRQLRTQTPGK
jgi:hypothetical protein